MEAYEILTQSVDKKQLPPLHQKRLLAFINHFLISSCSFLNDFAARCENKFIELERKMQRIEAALIIIEAKLDSVPAITADATTTTNTTQTNAETAVDVKEINATENTINETEIVTETASSTEIEGVKACEDVRYRKYFKMLQFGVPPPAVKLKMKSEGIENIGILDTPNMILSDGISANLEET